MEQQERGAEIVQSITSYEDERFLDSLWSYDACHEWFNAAKDHEPWKETYRWKDATNLGAFIEQHSNVKDWLNSAPDLNGLLLHYLEHMVAIISSVHKVQRGSLIGAGGFGKVFKASGYFYNTGKDVAIKTDDDSSFFKRETEMLAKVGRHQFIVQFFGTVNVESAKYIAMELCDGNLHGYVQEPNTADVDRVVLGQVVVALQHLHSKGIIHKDLNPNNILFKRTGCHVVHVKVADFGISKQKKLSTERFSNTEHKGTCGYIAPELLETNEPSFESDVWALGAVVYFVVSRGVHPFDLPNLNEQFKNALVQTLKNPPNAGKLDDWMADDLACKLMASDKCKRPNIFLVLLHPYFSTANDCTLAFLAGSINNFYLTEKQSRFKEMFQESAVTEWYEQLGRDWKSAKDEEFLRNISQSFSIPLGSTVEPPMKMKQEFSSEVDSFRSIQVVDKPVVNRIQQLLTKNPKLFGSFIWDALTSVGLTRTESEMFKNSELRFAIYHCPASFYKHLAEEMKPWSREDISLQLRQTVMIPDASVLAYLLQSEQVKACVSQVGFRGKTPLHVAAHCNRNPQIVKLLLEAGADVNATSESGWIPLHHAARYNPNEEIVRILLDAGATVNPPGNGGDSPLHVAAVGNANPEVIRLLLGKGADPLAENDKGETPVDKAHRNPNKDEILRVLRGLE